MKRLIIANSFSLSMLDREAQEGTPEGYTPHLRDEFTRARLPRPCDKDLFHSYLQVWLGDGVFMSCIGHADTAALLSKELGMEVPHNRVPIKLKEEDILFVAQYSGPRLPEGATELPDGASFDWWII